MFFDGIVMRTFSKHNSVVKSGYIEDENKNEIPNQPMNLLYTE